MAKRMVLMTDNMVGIFGVCKEDERPPQVLESPLGLINYVTTKTRYHLYRPITEPKMGYTFNPEQQ